MEPTLVILAAGLGTRYGGMKQIDHIGDNGETIIDFSIFDAYRAGFRNLVLIIKKEHEHLFEENLVKPIRKYMDVKYAYQDLNDLPNGYKPNKERVKPWGTTQALLSIRNIVDTPFMIINADDFYGYESYEIMYDFLKKRVKDNHFGMVGYHMSKTVSEHGSVTRALCKAENNLLKEIVEIRHIQLIDGKLYEIINDEKIEFEDGISSMNYWGFTPAIFPMMELAFCDFLKDNHDELKAEYVIPTAIGEIIKKNQAEVEVMSTKALWFGVTYSEDKEYARQKMMEYKKAGLYPAKLWQ